MRLLKRFFAILFILSCSKNNPNSNKLLNPFTVTVVNRAPTTAIISWTAALNVNNSDTVKYDIVMNGKVIKTNLLKTIDTLKNLSPDSLYEGRVYAKTISGDTASAPFVLENIGGYLVFGDINGFLNCYNLYSGNLLWATSITNSAYGFTDIATIVDSVIYLAANRGIFALNAKTGVKIWNNNPGSGKSSNPIYHNGNIYVVFGDKICSLNKTTGQIIWSFSETNSDYQSNPVIGGNLLFEFVARQQKIIAIDINTGTKSLGI